MRRIQTYSGQDVVGMDLLSVLKIIREEAGQQMPPGAVPEDRVAPSTQDGDVTSTVNGKTVWTPSEDLPGVVAAQAAADQAAADAAAVSGDLTAHITDTTAHPAAYITIQDVAGDFTASDVEGALAELQSDREAHEALSFGPAHALPTAATPMNGYGFTGLGTLQWNADTEISRDGSGQLLIGGTAAGTNDKWRMGSWSGATTTWVSLMHSAWSAGTQGIMMSDAGRVIINALSGSYTSFRVNTVDQAVIHAAGLVMPSGKEISFSSSANPTSIGDAVIARAGADWLDTPDLFTSRRAASGDQAFGASVIGDSAFRLRIGASGTLSWSDGTASQDTNLFRDGVDLLRTNDVFRADGGFRTGVQAFTASGTISATAGGLVYFAGSAGQTLTLPTAAAGYMFDLFVTDGSDSVTLARAASDTIYPGEGGLNATSIVLQPGQRVRIVCLVAGRWDIAIMDSHDTSAMPASAQAPTSGNHLVNKTYADLKVLKAGDTMSGDLTREGGTGTTRRIQARQTGDASGRAALGVLSTDAGYLALGDGTAMDWILSRSAANIAALAAGDKIQQNTAPTAGDDLTNKTYVDALGTDAATASTIMRRDASGRAKIADPSAATDIANKQWVETQDGLLIPKSLLTTRGDIVTRDASAPVRLAVGAANTELRSDGTDPSWKATPFQVISERAGRYGSGLGTSVFVIGVGEQVYYYGSTGSSGTHFYIDPADWGSSGVTLRLRGWCQTEADPTDSTLQAQVGKLTTPGAVGTISGASAVTTLSDVSMSVTAANTMYSDVGVDTTITSAGWYFVAFLHSVNPAQGMTYGYTLMGRPA